MVKKSSKPRSRRTELYPQTFISPSGNRLTWHGWAKPDDEIYTRSGWNYLSGKNLNTHGIDISFANHGSIWLMTPETDAGREWIEKHIPDDAQMSGGSIAIEPRFVVDIVEGAAGDGLDVEVEGHRYKIEESR